MHAIRSSLSSLQSLLSYPVLLRFVQNFLICSTVCNLLTLRLVAEKVLAKESRRNNLELREGLNWPFWDSELSTLYCCDFLGD